MKNYSPSVDRNKDPILEVLQGYLSQGRLLEIGSGNGQHAVYFAQKLPRIHWVTTDMKENHPAIKEWLKEAKIPNLHGPEQLKVGVDDFPKGVFNFVFTANTLHIMSWKEAKCLFKLLGKRLREDAVVFIYGPFNYGGEFTSTSNETFDQWLKDRDTNSGVRNFEDVSNNMNKAGFDLLFDHEMPSNNRMLVFKRQAYRPKG